MFLPNIISQFQVRTKMVMIKKNKLKHTNKGITQIIILIKSRMSQVKVTAKVILMKN